jgi:hypothetical protein
MLPPAPAVAALLMAGLQLSGSGQPTLIKRPPPPTVFEVRAGEPVAVTLHYTPERSETFNVTLTTAQADRLVLNDEIIKRLGIRPAFFNGFTVAKIGPTTVLKGRNTSVDYTVAKVDTDYRLVWFLGLNRPGTAGSIGPAGIPIDAVRIRLPGPGTKPYNFAMAGDLNSHSATRYATRAYRFGLSFAVESTARYPIASAAAGAAIAKAHGGTVSTETWDEEVMLGIRRPVRRVDLARPLVIGPFSFSTIAVRVRDARDATGSGAALPPPPPGPDDDPSEIAVTAKLYRGPPPIQMLTIPASALATCSSLEYDKKLREIRLGC